MSLTNFKFNHKVKLFFFVLLSISNFIIFASKNTSRYFPFLERSSEYILNKKTHLTASLFFSRASTAFRRGGGNTGIPELWGKYDLRDVIASLEQTETGYVNPIQTERGPKDSWLDKSIIFKVNGKLKGFGCSLNYEHFLNWNSLAFGLSIPVMHLYSSDNFAFVSHESDSIFNNLRSGELEQVDKIRRKVQDDLGLHGGEYTTTGLGDLDFHISFNKNWQYKLMMRSVELCLRLGMTSPTGKKSNIDYPSSVSFMGNGHWSTYFDIATELELKQDWKFGFIFASMYQFNHNRILRLPVYQEPAIFSNLVAKTKIDPGMTFKFSAYLLAENISDGINFQARYTYLRHNNDKYYDKRVNPSVKSYLNQDVGTTLWTGKTLTQEDINDNISVKENLSRWRSHYLSLEVAYNAKEAGNDWKLDPIIFLNYDYIFNGNASSKTHQLTLGAQVHF